VTTARRWERLPEQRPGQLVEAALQEFGDRGYDDTRLEDVAERAGVSKGTVYQYFANKQALFDEVIRHTLDKALGSLTVPPTGESAARDLLQFMEKAWEVMATTNFERVHRLVLGEIHKSPESAELYARHLEEIRLLLCEVVDRGVATGEFRPVDVRVATRMVLALLVKHGVWVRQPEFWPELHQRPGTQVLGEIYDFALRALRAESPRPADHPKPTVGARANTR
jgi:TetR/AcrR family transcriptional regulator